MVRFVLDMNTSIVSPAWIRNYLRDFVVLVAFFLDAVGFGPSPAADCSCS